MNDKLIYTNIKDIPDIVKNVHKVYNSGISKSINWRKEQLKNIISMLKSEKDLLYSALKKDLNRPKGETWINEISQCLNEAVHALNNIDEWTSKQYIKNKPMALAIDKVYKLYEPLGVQLIIAPWNYPIGMILIPLINSIAAGNLAIIKPSEISVNTSIALTYLLSKYLHIDAFQVVNGGVKETTELLKQKFDHIFFTGSSFVGKIVMKAAAVNLTPVVLELGGKSPTYLSPKLKGNALRNAVRRITRAKFVNVGQTCIAPDYLVCSKDHNDLVVKYIAEAIKDFYNIDKDGNRLSYEDNKDGEEKGDQRDYCCVISENHFVRLQTFFENKNYNVVMGGKHNKADRYISPTVILAPPKDSKLLTEEIFGPILPIVNIETIDNYMEYVNSRPKPLASYIFSEDKKEIETILKNTTAGGSCVNDAMIQVGLSSLPFGGVGNSGHGHYHGFDGFIELSNCKSVLQRGLGLQKLEEMTAYPKYGSLSLYNLLCMEKQHSMFKKLLKGLYKKKKMIILLIILFKIWRKMK